MGAHPGKIGNLFSANSYRGFIDHAKKESIDTILEAIELKKQGVIRNLYVAGCLSERYRAELEVEMPEVDRFFGTMTQLTALTVPPMSDAGPVTGDAATDANLVHADGGMMPPIHAGCGCRSADDGSSNAATLGLVLGVGLMLVYRRRRSGN